MLYIPYVDSFCPLENNSPALFGIIPITILTFHLFIRTYAFQLSFSLTKILCQRLLRHWVKPLLHNVDDPAVMAGVRIFQILSNPRLDIRDLWEGVTRRLLASIELSKTNAKTGFVNICIRDDIICSSRNRGVDQELDQALRRECPTFGVSIDKRL